MLNRLERSLVNAFAERVSTILQVQSPFQFEVDHEMYQAEFQSTQGRESILSIYKVTSRTPTIHAIVRVSGMF